MSKEELVILVDEQDKQIGLKEKLKAHELGLLHRAFSVFLFREKNGEIQVLLQKRALDKYHCGGLWANTCCSHPRDGEDIIDAGKRRVRQELGIDVDELKEVGTFIYRAEFENKLIEHEIDHVLIGVFSDYDEEKINFNKEEVDSVRWVSLDELKKELDKKDYIWVPWVNKAFGIISRQDIENLFK